MITCIFQSNDARQPRVEEKETDKKESQRQRYRGGFGRGNAAASSATGKAAIRSLAEFSVCPTEHIECRLQLHGIDIPERGIRLRRIHSFEDRLQPGRQGR